ncbi:MAG: hypothetical protein EA382_07685, partial [Spirochaetaceae bacterium]
MTVRRTLLVALLIASIGLITGCDRLLFGGAVPNPKLDPPPGTYAEPIFVQPVRDRNADEYYYSTDPSAPINQFRRLEEFRVTDEVSFRYFAVSWSALRSEILVAEYRIDPSG